MRGAKFHGNTCSDSTTRVFSIGIMWVMRIMRIVSPFSPQIGISNAGPASALESMGENPTFHCHALNNGLMDKQYAKKGYVDAPKSW